MIRHREIQAYALSALTGILAVVVIEFVWGLYALYQPVNEWLIDNILSPGHIKSYYAIIHVHDIVVNVALAYPFAFLFANVAPAENRGRYLLVSAVTMFLWSYGMMLIGDPWSFFADPSPVTFVGVAMTCGSLPLAYLLLRHQRGGANFA